MSEILSLVSGVIAALALSFLAEPVGRFLQQIFIVLRKYRIKVGGVEITLLNSSDATMEEIETRVQELREHPRVFLSYSNADRDFAYRLARDLRSNGIDIWTAEEQLKVGDPIAERVGEAMSSSQWFVVVLSGKSLESDFVKRELEAALLAEQKRKRVFVLPILYEGNRLPSSLADRVFADFRESYETGFKRLLSSLKRTQNESLFDVGA